MDEHASGSQSPEGFSGDDGVRIRDRSERLAARLRRTAGHGPSESTHLRSSDGDHTGAVAATGAWDGAATGAWVGVATGASTAAGADGPEGATAALAQAGVSRVGGSALLASHPDDERRAAAIVDRATGQQASDGHRSGGVADLLNAPRRPLPFYVAPFGTPPFGNPPGAAAPWPGSDRAVRARPVWGPPQREV